MVVLTIIALLLSVVVPDYVGRIRARRGGGTEGEPGGHARRARQALRRRRQVSRLDPGAGRQALPAQPSRPTRSRSRRPPGSPVPPTDPQQGASSTCAAARRAMSAGRQQGFTLIAALILLAADGRGPGRVHRARLLRDAAREGGGAAVPWASSTGRRSAPTTGRSVPTRRQLTELVEDRRYPMPVRHLRKLYGDPMTGQPDWAIIKAPERRHHGRAQQVRGGARSRPATSCRATGSLRRPRPMPTGSSCTS